MPAASEIPVRKLVFTLGEGVSTNLDSPPRVNVVVLQGRKEDASAMHQFGLRY
jgi:hypothetical protein